MATVKERFTQVVGPNEAAELLRYNSRNRPLSGSRLKRYTRSMLDGSFRNNNDPVKVFMCEGAEPVLVNGQHRLHSIIQSGQSVEMDILYKWGTPEELAHEFVLQDGGKGRDARDAFTTAYRGDRGGYSARDLAVVSRAISVVDILVKEGMAGNYGYVDNDMLVHIAEQNQEEMIWGCGVRVAMHRETKTTMPLGVLANAIEAFRVDRDVATAFYSQVTHGENIASGMPAYLLRREIVGIRNLLSNQTIIVKQWYNRAGYAWNAHVDGRTLFRFSPKADVWIHPAKPRIPFAVQRSAG